MARKGSTKNGTPTVVVIIVALAIFYFSGNSSGLNVLEDIFGDSRTNVAVANPIDISADEAIAALGNVESRPLQNVDYNRVGQFGPSWKDMDRNGCDTRNDILARDLTDTKKDRDQCVILSGTLLDPYTGKTIDFVRGVDTSHKVQIDHIVSLSTAARSGALSWDQKTRELFANDPINLIASDGPANGAKSDKGPGDWLPDNTAFHCEFVAAYVNVVATYGLTMPAKDLRTSQQVLSRCGA